MYSENSSSFYYFPVKRIGPKQKHIEQLAVLILRKYRNKMLPQYIASSPHYRSKTGLSYGVLIYLVTEK